jgi:hypothetical protein
MRTCLRVGSVLTNLAIGRSIFGQFPIVQPSSAVGSGRASADPVMRVGAADEHLASARRGSVDRINVRRVRSRG